MGNSFLNPLPWSLCGQEWNTQQCRTERVARIMQKLNISVNNTIDDYMTNKTTTMTGFEQNVSFMLTDINNETKRTITSEEEFWQ